MSQITIINNSTVVADVDVQSMVEACNQFLPNLTGAWNMGNPQVVFNSDKTATGNWHFYIVNTDSDVPGALAYHTETNDQVVGYILAQTILQNGGVVLYQDHNTPSVASALFHEIAEALIDPTVNIWWLAGNNQMYAGEVCDPVQDNIVPVVLDSNNQITVGLSNFIFPAWRDQQAGIGSEALINSCLTIPQVNKTPATTTNKNTHKPQVTHSGKNKKIAFNPKNVHTKSVIINKNKAEVIRFKPPVSNRKTPTPTPTRTHAPSPTPTPTSTPTPTITRSNIQYDYQNVLTAPFTLTTGGYFVVLNPMNGNTQQIFGAMVPHWVRKMKTSSRRIVGRKKHIVTHVKH